MTNWHEKINLHDVLSTVNANYDLSRVEEKCPAEVKAALAAEIKKSKTLSPLADKIIKAKTIAGVNRVLVTVFDTADRELVWCGMP